MVYRVKPDTILERLTEEMADLGALEPPEWASYVKTGVSRQRAPEQEDWWHRRAASMLRRVYVDGPIGVRRLSKRYGGKRRGGVGMSHFEPGSRNVTRTILQQLEEEGLVEKRDRQGRGVSPEGRALLDRLMSDLVEG